MDNSLFDNHRIPHRSDTAIPREEGHTDTGFERVTLPSAQPPPWVAERIVTHHGLSPPVARFLSSRGFSAGSELHQYLTPTLPEEPKMETIPEIVGVAHKIVTTLTRNEPIKIQFSTDLDSVLGAASIASYLKSHGAKIDCFQGPEFQISANSLQTKFALDKTSMSLLLIAALNRELQCGDDWRTYTDFTACALASRLSIAAGLTQKLIWSGVEELSRYKRPGFVALLNNIGIDCKITPGVISTQLAPLLDDFIQAGQSASLVGLLTCSNLNDTEIYSDLLLSTHPLRAVGVGLGMKLAKDPGIHPDPVKAFDTEIVLDEINFKVEEQFRWLDERGSKTATPIVMISGLSVGETDCDPFGNRSVKLYSGSQRITALLGGIPEHDLPTEGEIVDLSGRLALSISPRKEVVILPTRISPTEQSSTVPPRIELVEKPKIQKPEWPVTISRDQQSIDYNLSELRKRRGVPLALDFETTVEENQQLCTVSISDAARRKNYFFDFVKSVDAANRVEQHDTSSLRALLEDSEIVTVIHEEHFERKVSRSLAIFPRSVIDTRTLGQVVRPDIKRTGLKEYVWACLGKSMEKSIRVRDWARERNLDGSLPEDLLNYGVCDTEYLAQLYAYMHNLLAKTAIPKNLNVADLTRGLGRCQDHRYGYVEAHVPELTVLEAFESQLIKRAEELVLLGALPIDGEAGIAQFGERSTEIDAEAFAARFRRFARPFAPDLTIEKALEQITKPGVNRVRLVRFLLQPENRELGFESTLDIDEFLRDCYKKEVTPGKSVIKPHTNIKPIQVISEVDPAWGLPRVMREFTSLGQRIQDIKFNHPKIPELDLKISRYKAQIEYLFSLGAEAYRGKGGYAAPSYHRALDPELVAAGLRERAADLPGIDIEKILHAVNYPKITRKDVRKLLESGFSMDGEDAKLHFEDLSLRSREVQRSFFAKVSRVAAGFIPPQVMPGAR